MPEPIATVGLSAIAAYLSRDGITKILGPTAEYLGDELKEFTKKRINNIGSIFKNAEEKLGEKIDEYGVIPPKVLRTIINEGSYSEGEIAIEYFGGVLASSRTELSRDDRGVRISKLLDNLSSYQLRCHYLIYSSISNIFKGQKQSFRLPEERRKLEVFMPMNEFVSAMGLTQKEYDNPQIFTHIFHGLSSDDLINSNWACGPQELLKTTSRSEKINQQGVVCTPTASGAELFLWGFGHGCNDLDLIFTDEFSSNINNIPALVINSCATKT